MGYGPVVNGKHTPITPYKGSWASVVNEKGFMNPNKFENTAKALAVFDAGKPARDEAWSQINNDTDVANVEADELAALRLVQEAFYEDTKHINSLDHCYRADLQFMRRMAKGD